MEPGEAGNGSAVSEAPSAFLAAGNWPEETEEEEEEQKEEGSDTCSCLCEGGTEMRRSPNWPKSEGQRGAARARTRPHMNPPFRVDFYLVLSQLGKHQQL